MEGATLADRLQVAPEWAQALDKVLGRWLTATPADECNLAQEGLWIGPAQPAVAGTLAAQLGGEHIPAFPQCHLAGGEPGGRIGPPAKPCGR